MNADVAQWVACSPVTEKVAGSNPSLDEAFLFIFICKKLRVDYEARNQRCHGQRGLQATMGDVLNNVPKCP
jgi:hypothetical protein